jgi:hypothetical protein
MSTSQFLARLIGPVMIAVGVGVVTNRAAFHKLAGEFLDQPALLFLSGLMLMPAGLAIVLTHNVWAADWRVLVTLLGGAALISGAIRLAAPIRAAGFARRAHAIGNYASVAGAVWAVLGVALSYFGYSA